VLVEKGLGWFEGLGWFDGLGWFEGLGVTPQKRQRGRAVAAIFL